MKTEVIIDHFSEIPALGYSRKYLLYKLYARSTFREYPRAGISAIFETVWYFQMLNSKGEMVELV